MPKSRTAADHAALVIAQSERAAARRIPADLDMSDVHADAARMSDAPDVVSVPAAQLVAVVSERAAELIYTDRSFGNASDWAELQLVPGEYPVQLVDLQYRELPADTLSRDAYWIVVRVAAVELRSGGTNRLFTASSAVEREGRGESTKHFQTYAYNVADGYVLASTPDPTETDKWAHAPLVTLRVITR